MGSQPKISSGVLHGAVETSAAEPVVEFARRRSAGQVADENENAYQSSARATVSKIGAPSHCGSIALPRNLDQPLLELGNTPTAAADAYKGLRARLLKAQSAEPFRSVAITSAARNEGKTVTAFNLACCCAQVENLTTLLIDGDLRSSNLSRRIELPSTGLADVMSSSVPCREAVFETDIPNLHVMSAGATRPHAIELFSTGRWVEVIAWAQSHFKLVLVDTVSIGALAEFDLIAGACDRIMVVVRTNWTSRDALNVAIDQIGTKKLLGVVLNADYSNNGQYAAR